MPGDDFHQRPFDDGTLTKLRIFELYAREWLPIFLAPERPRFAEIHLFDFFAGPGMDSAGEFGSPLRLLRQLRDFRDLPGWSKVRIVVHFFDESPEKIRELEQPIADRGSSGAARAAIQADILWRELRASRYCSPAPLFRVGRSAGGACFRAMGAGCAPP